uniref:Uncharacterized protein n=1 Tax=Aegilops tauschii subsp. strangulata TaxID=200361 RepID=A0A453BY16_AEGTS
RSFSTCSSSHRRPLCPSVSAMVVLGGRVAWACSVLLLLQLAGASHVVYETHLLETEAAAADVPPSILDAELSTGYHFRPIKNWINGWWLLRSPNAT